MQQRAGVLLTLRGFDGAGAVVKADFPIDDILKNFHTQFQSEWAKRTRKLPLTQHVTVEGNFIRLDAGSRFLRYLIPFITGQAVLEIEAKATVDGRPLLDFHRAFKYSMGLFGGSSKSLLTVGAGDAASQIVKQVVGSLKKQ